MHISGHAVSSFTEKRVFGWAAVSARWQAFPRRERWEWVATRAAPVSMQIMEVQVGGPSAVWMERTALGPSPMAEAARFSKVGRTSPAANTVGMLVSHGSGVRPALSRWRRVPSDRAGRQMTA